MSTTPDDIDVASHQCSEISTPSCGNHSNDANLETRLTESNSTRFSHIGSTLVSSLKWCPTSEAELAAAEAELLKG